MTEQQIHYTDVIINAIPVSITRYENPAAPDIKYEIEFETPTGRHIKIGKLCCGSTTGNPPKTIEEILAELRSKGLVYKIKAAEESLQAILEAYYREIKMTIKSELETPGFYWQNNKIVSYKTDNLDYTQQEIIQCVDLLDDLSRRYKRREIFATVVKWALIAPFNFVLKQMQNEDLWLPWLHLYGWTNTGKTTIGRIALAIWRKQNDKIKHDIGFASVDTIPRFGRAISYNTYPILINEVNLNDRKNESLVEVLKHAVQSQTARSRLSGPTRSTAEHFAALSACILTGNPRPPEDPAFQRRIIPIHLSQDDIPSAEEEKEFNLILKNDIDILGTLGDFAANYIINHDWKDDWKTLAKEILTAFYKAADREVPVWVNDFVQESQIQDIMEEQEQVIRGFLMKVVNDSHSRNYMSLTSTTDREHQNNDFQSRLLFCLDNDLISFLKRKRNEPEKILILHDIINNMKAQGINHISNLADLGRMLQCEIKPTKLSGKSVRLVEISIDRFIEFVNPITE